MRDRRTVRHSAGDTVGQVGHQWWRGLRRPPTVPLMLRKGGQPPPPTSARPACPPLSPCAACRGGQPKPSGDAVSHLSHLVPLPRNQKAATNSRYGMSYVSHVSHCVPRYRSRMSCDGPGMRGGRRVDVHAPFAGGVGVRPAGAPTAAVPWRHVYATCSRDRDAPRPSWACDGRTGRRKRTSRGNVSGLRANARCGRVRTRRRQRAQAATARAVLVNGQNTGWY
jgi:hypothetical protein